MSNVAGEIYFIAEEPSMSAPPVRVKIGLVRESQKRDSRDRRSDHQTGNPRRLILLEAIHTARVSKVENSLHKRLASRRGLGEWFELSEAELKAALETCRELAEQQAVHLPVIRLAGTMRGTSRNDTVIATNDKINNWHLTHQVATASLSVFKNLKNSYSALVKAAQADGVDVDEFAKVSQVQMSCSSWFKEFHPAEYEASKQAAKSVKFSPQSLKAEPALEADEKSLCKEFEARLTEWSPGVGFTELHRLYLELLLPMQIWKEELELATAYLKFFCDQNRGIHEVCEWKPMSSRKFSRGIAEDRYPQLVELYAAAELPSSPGVTLRGGDESEESDD